MHTPKIKHLLYVPFTGLGLHNGFRGNEWLKNRLRIFRNFVLPSLQAQTNQDFILWFSWRREEKNNPLVQFFINELHCLYPLKEMVHTFSGCCFYDDKYPDEIARDRLVTSIHGSLPSLLDSLGECDEVYMTIQPSDDLYHKNAVEAIQNVLQDPRNFQAVGFQKGYICNYMTKDVCEYNPDTNPPFYTIKFPKAVFIDPLSHARYTSLKKDSGKYKAGTPCPSHEYIGECLKYAVIGDIRGFLVGTHGVNISTTFTNPYKGPEVDKEILKDFGIYDVEPLSIKISPFKKLLLKLPYKVQRKIRYISNEWKLLQLSTWPGLLK